MKKETLEEAAERLIPDNFIKVAPKKKVNAADISRHYFIEGAKWQAERMYSEEEVYKILLNYQSNYPYASNEIGLKKWFEEFKKK